MKEGLMAAILVRVTDGKGGWNKLELGETPIPHPGEDKVLIRIEACSVNRADLLQRRGLYPPPPGTTDIPGLDFAGQIVQTAEQSQTNWKVGDRVFGIVAGGGYGRYAAVSENHLVRIPDTMNFVEAAAAAEVFFTAYLNIFIEAKMQPGEFLLIHGGGERGWYRGYPACA